MEKISKSVWQKLQTPVAEAHPDANLLTAFAEHSLPESERASVTGHLANCADCREVVALALPDIEATTVTAVKGVGRGWSSLPVLRWGVVAAGVVVLTSIGIVQYKQHQPRESNLASLQAGDKVMPAIENPKAATPAPAPYASNVPAPRPQASPIKTKKEAEGRSPAFPALAQGLSMDRKRVGTGIGGGIGAGMGAVSGAVSSAASSPKPNSAAPNPGKPALPMIVPQQSEVVDVEAQSGAVNSEAAQASNQIAQNQNNLPLNGRNVTDLDVVKAKDAESARRAAAPAPGASALALQTQSAVVAQTLPRWSISSGGALQRSLDSGKTWEKVNLTPALVSGAAMTVPVQGDGSYPDVNADKAEQKRMAKTEASPLLRAVFAIGPEVWVGGAGALLYHSTDVGAHWVRIVPATPSVALSGDITHIQFSDPQHGTVATSTGEAWSTDDAGQSWQKQ